MKINKRCLSAFSKTKPLLALGTKSKLFDTTFSLTSELSLYDYSSDTHHPTLQLDRKFSKLLWCEKNDKSILATGHDNGVVSLYDTTGDTLRLLNTFDGMEKDVLGLDYNASKNVLAAGSSGGKIIFWNLDKIDQQYKCDIPINANITALSWNRKVSRILAAGTDDGRILVLDIRAKSIAMTLESPEIKNVSHVAWHPTCPTSIFASSRNLHSFNLSTDSVVDIKMDNLIGFDILNDNTLVAYSRNRIDYIDVESQRVKESEEGHLIYDASFSSRDPLACLSSSDGFTTVTGRRESSVMPSQAQAILLDYVVGKDSYKISYESLSSSHSEDLSHRVLKKIYEDGKFNLNNSNRKEVGRLILEESESDFLKDPVVMGLIKEDLEPIPSSSKVSLRFVVDLLRKKEIKEKNPVELILYIMASGRYEEVVESLPMDQWRVMVSLILLSDYPLEKARDIFKEISSRVEDKGLLFLLTSQPGEYLALGNTKRTPPSSIFEVNDFFVEFLPEVEKVKALKINSDNKFLEEFVWYAKDRGLNELVQDLNVNVKEKVEVPKAIEKKAPVGVPISSNEGRIPSNSSNVGRIPSNSTIGRNISTPSIGRVSTSSTGRIPTTPSTGRIPTIPSPTIPSPTIPSPTTSPSIPSSTTPSQGFITRPPVKPSLYSCSASGSTPSFIQKPRQENVPGTYGSEETFTSGSSFTSGSTKPSIPKPGTIPKPGAKSSFPSPDLSRNVPMPGTSSLRASPPTPNAPKPPSPTEYNPVELSEQLEKVYEKLKEEASKKNNLIIGNKIKDANRRFSIFLNLDKQSLTRNVLYRISLMVQTFRDIPERDVLKQSVRTIVEESIDLQENQCNIWIPAIYTLVQLVY